MTFREQKTEDTRQKADIRYLLSCVLCLLFSILASSAFAQSTLRVEADGGANYLDGLAQLFDAANRVAPDTRQSNGPLLRVSPDGSVSIAGNSRPSAQDAELIENARQLFRLYRSLGGQTGSRALLLQYTRNGLFTAREGSAGAVSSTLGGAMGSALRSIARADASLPATAASWIPQLASALETPGIRPLPYPVARIPRNQRTVINLSGPEIARAGADAILAGPPGSTINILATDGDRLQASTVFSQSTPDGFTKLYLYRAKDVLTPVTSFDVSIGAGRENPATDEPDDHGATAHTATALLPAGATRATGDGKIGASNDVDMFALSVTTPGLLSVSSHGSSDLTAHLLDSRGNPVASNDDGGAGYNFGIQAAVSPGRYLLSVQHCCGGNGKYQLDTKLTPR